MAAGTFPELGIVTVVRGRRSRRSTQFDVCRASGRKVKTHRGGTRIRCDGCGRTVRVTSRHNLPVHMRTVQVASARKVS